MSKNQDDELEYQFSSEEEYDAGRSKANTGETTTNRHNESSQAHYEDIDSGRRSSSQGWVGQLSFFKNKRLLFVVLAILVLFVYFKMSQPDLNQNKIVKPVTAMKKVVPEMSQVSDSHYALKNKVDNLEKSLNNSEGNYSILQNKLNTLNDTLSKMVASQQQLYKAVSVLATDYNNMKSRLKKKKVKSSPALPKKVNVWSPSKTFTLHAVIPGRAWLEDNHHIFSTVAVGDVLPEYGKILEIDADNNRVVTSSGHIIIAGSR